MSLRLGSGRIFLYREPCDMRRGFRTLSAIVGVMGHEVTEGDAFVFVSKNRRRCKVLWYDATGLCLLYKRIDAGYFAAPWGMSGDGALELTLNEMALFFEGCEMVGKLRLSPEPVNRAAATVLNESNFG